MYFKILLSLFVAVFISACATKPKDSAETSGTGSSADNATAETAETAEVQGGSQEDLIVNVGDRVFFGYDS